jgi:hypothetical protein
MALKIEVTEKPMVFLPSAPVTAVSKMCSAWRPFPNEIFSGAGRRFN